MTITLCLVVKNEEAYLSRCIESVQPLVSEILIGDTGSTDATVEIAKCYTTQVESVDFSQGFSAARNALLRKVKTDWILFLDADESFDSSQIEVLQSLVQETGADAIKNIRYNFFATGGFYISEVIRLFRNDPLIEYSGIIVDSIVPSIEKAKKRIVSAPLVLNHFGHCRPVALRNQKAHKYLEMMNREIDSNPENYKVVGYKALVLKSLGRFEEAFSCSDRALQLAPNASHPYFVRARILRGMGEPIQELSYYNRAIALDPNNLIYLNSRGVAYLTHGHIREAQEDFRLGIDRSPYQVHFKLNLALTFEALKQFEEAYLLYREIAKSHPAFLESSFSGNCEVDLYSGNIYDTIFRFHGLAYHMAYCHAQISL